MAAAGSELQAILPDPSTRFVHQQWTVEDGLPVNALTDVVQTPDGWLWIASFDGLLRFDGVRFTRYDTVAAPALGSNRIVQLEVDAAGRLYVLSERGHLSRFAGGRLDAVETSGGDSPAGVQMAVNGAGILWLATGQGIYRAEDTRLTAGPGELRDMPVHALGASALGRIWIATDDGRLRSFEIEYTALSLRAPDRIHFRYRLEGYDDGWVEAGARREAFYTKVPPGIYAFQVQARSAEGVWNRAGSRLALVVPGAQAGSGARLRAGGATDRPRRGRGQARGPRHRRRRLPDQAVRRARALSQGRQPDRPAPAPARTLPAGSAIGRRDPCRRDPSRHLSGRIGYRLLAPHS